MSYYIIYPRGDRSKIGVVEIPDSMSYELSDYAVASRREFHDDEGAEARRYAKKLIRHMNQMNKMIILIKIW